MARGAVWLGVDVGGTFTDAVAYDVGERRLRWAKAPSTPDNPAAGVLDALVELVDDLADVEHFVHGVTIGTNAVIERRGADVWVVTTAGFRDTLEIQRTERRELYDIKTLKPASFVPRIRVLEANERLRADASVMRPLDPGEARSIARRLSSGGAESVAVCFLHSYADDAHERAMQAAVERALPDAYVCRSSEVLPEIREYERFSTTVLNAYLGPLMARYLAELESALADHGLRRTVFLMTSSGGVTSAERARRLPVQTVLSGPAGGVAASIALGRRLGLDRLITYDMGGTSTDVCLVESGRATLTTEQAIGGYPNRTPQLEIVTIGAGGGSVAWIDDGAILKVGPRSAGADPGPAAYGRGGTEPTVTDANLVLGRLGAGVRLAGTLALDAGLASGAVERVRAALGGRIEPPAMAEGMVRIAVARMVSAIKEISVAKGHDPRDFALLAYGGAGPMHGALIAEELEIGRVVVPPSPGNFSAFGCMVSDLGRTHGRTVLLETRRAEWDRVAEVITALEARGRRELEREGTASRDVSFRRELGMRYVGQSWELAVPADGVASMAEAERVFAAGHERRYGHASDDPAEIVTIRVTAVGSRPRLELDPARPGGGEEESARSVYFSGAWCETRVLARGALSPGHRVAGPALIEEMGSVTVVPPGWHLLASESGDLFLGREPPGGGSR